MSDLSKELQNPGDGDLAFFGKITASLSHEINNVLSIINELSGLMGDLLEASSRGKALDPEKLALQVEKIAAQILRGERLIKRLNSFSHSVDRPIKTFSLNELLNDIFFLSERFATLKGISLRLSIPDDTLSIENNPFKLQKAVFAILETLFASASTGAIVKLSCSGTAESSEIAVVCESETVTEIFPASSQKEVSDLVEYLGGKTAFSTDDKGCIIKLEISNEIAV
jgi:signal transduction histidine kinase